MNICGEKKNQCVANIFKSTFFEYKIFVRFPYAAPPSLSAIVVQHKVHSVVLK